MPGPVRYRTTSTSPPPVANDGRAVRECSAAFRVGAEASYGGMRKFASLVTKMQDRASARFSFFTPRPDEVFGDLDEETLRPGREV